MNLYKEGFFTQLETIHLHIDGTSKIIDLEQFLEGLGFQGFQSKTHKVLGFIAGPQRDKPEFKQTYSVDTTGFADESFDHFSTTLIKLSTRCILSSHPSPNSQF